MCRDHYLYNFYIIMSLQRSLTIVLMTLVCVFSCLVESRQPFHWQNFIIIILFNFKNLDLGFINPNSRPEMVTVKLIHC